MRAMLFSNERGVVGLAKFRFGFTGLTATVLLYLATQCGESEGHNPLSAMSANLKVPDGVPPMPGPPGGPPDMMGDPSALGGDKKTKGEKNRKAGRNARKRGGAIQSKTVKTMSQQVKDNVNTLTTVIKTEVVKNIDPLEDRGGASGGQGPEGGSDGGRESTFYNNIE